MNSNEMQRDLNNLNILASALGVDIVIDKDGLLMPREYFSFKENASEDDFNYVCNGAGPKGLDYLVPDTMYGLNMNPVFFIHDFCYGFFNDIIGKVFSDLLMSVNMTHFIERNTTSVWGIGLSLKFLRKKRASKYYFAVFVGGDSSFYNTSLNTQKILLPYKDSEQKMG